MVDSDQRSPQTCSWSYPEMFLLVVLHLLIVSVGGSPGLFLRLNTPGLQLPL